MQGVGKALESTFNFDYVAPLSNICSIEKWKSLRIFLLCFCMLNPVKYMFFFFLKRHKFSHKGDKSKLLLRLISHFGELG